MLLSLYRPARNSNILSQALSGSVAETISVAAELNSNKSVKTLTVSRAATNVTYTFEYTE
jgi:hypothetical protein